MANNYSISEFMKNVYSLIMTRLTMKQARFVRRPIYIRGKKSIHGAVGLTTGRNCRFDLQGNKKTLYIGKNCEFGDMTHIVAHNKVVIGDNVLIASKCFISDTNHGNYKGIKQDTPFSIPKERKLNVSETIIGDNVWIGENVVVLPGVCIGNGSIVGANCVVTKNIPSNCIVVGSPAKVVKSYNDITGRWEYLKEGKE